MGRDGPQVAVASEARGSGVFSPAPDSVPAGRLGLEPGYRDGSQEAYDELLVEYQSLERLTGLLRRVIQVVRPAVVHIEAAKRSGTQASDGQARPVPPAAAPLVEEAGSGTIIRLNDRFYILTNRHVVLDADLDRIRVQFFDNRVVYPQQVWTDRATDVGVLAIDGQHHFAARVGDSDDVEMGDLVLAFGSPFGLHHSVTHGMISAKGRRDLQLGIEAVQLQDFLQTDAAINPGNSGGPLVNLRGEVIGVNTAIASNSGGNEGIGFSIPINMAMLVAKQLVQHGRLERAYLGVQLDAMFDPSTLPQSRAPQQCGARVSGVSAGSPAASAQLLPGDIVLQFDGRWVEDDSHLISLVGLAGLARSVPVLVLRNGEEVELTVELVARTSEIK